MFAINFAHRTQPLFYNREACWSIHEAPRHQRDRSRRYAQKYSSSPTGSWVMSGTSPPRRNSEDKAGRLLEKRRRRRRWLHLHWPMVRSLCHCSEQNHLVLPQMSGRHRCRPHFLKPDTAMTQILTTSSSSQGSSLLTEYDHNSIKWNSAQAQFVASSPVSQHLCGASQIPQHRKRAQSTIEKAAMTQSRIVQRRLSTHRHRSYTSIAGLLLCVRVTAILRKLSMVWTSSDVPASPRRNIGLNMVWWKTRRQTSFSSYASISASCYEAQQG